MKLSVLGENALVAELTRGLPQRSDVVVGPGDDCAVIAPLRDGRRLLLKTDALVEGVHFLLSHEPRRVGWKALCRAISDIAAMGGEPEHAVITIALSPEVQLAWIKALYAGLGKAARAFGVAIVGGETSRSPGPAFINVALTGRVSARECVLRSGGKPGDVLYVTGRLGGSRAGKHLDFTPRLPEARWLVSHFRLHAMMDLSDGLAADLPRLAAASGCGFTLNHETIPRTRGCTLENALNDGEDFELLFAIPPRHGAKLEAAWKRTFPKLRLTAIGSLTRRSAFNSEPPHHGFDHFAQS
jgi:thiamine-monophosphate kinase